MGNKKKTKNIRSGMNAITSCISTTLVLILLGTVVFFVTIARNFSTSIRENFTILLLLDDNISRQHVYELQTQLKQLKCSRGVTYISKERAQKEQAVALGTDSTDFLQENLMPASFEVHLKANYANRDSLNQIVPLLKRDVSILEVNYPESLMDSLNDNIKKVSTVMLIVALLLTIVSFELINNTIRLSVHARRFLIHTMALVGASWSFIRRPFLWKAFWIGFISALIAAVVLICGMYAIVNYEPQMLDLITDDVLAATIGVVFICGIMLTFLCAYVSVNKNLNMSYDRLNRW